MEHPRAVEHHRCGKEKQGPLCPGRVTGPQGLLEPHTGRVIVWNKRHVNYAEDERRNGGDNREKQTPQEVLLFTPLHMARAVLERGRPMDGGREACRRLSGHRDGCDNGADREVRRRRRISYCEDRVGMGGKRLVHYDFRA